MLGCADDVWCCRYEKCQQIDDYPCYGASGNDVLDSISDDDLDYNKVNEWESFAVLCAMAVGLRLAFYFVLKRHVS